MVCESAVWAKARLSVLVHVVHCPYGALSGGACGQRLAAVGNRLRLSTDVSRCA
uniref:P27 n=1 Tax=Xylella fastidiosa TaxID=2371 RepID=D5LLC4_XYLFS|nr:P27 [Xylella fastidiosa]ADF29447.1 P27 [Xylella fastidiosa]ADF29477.1 P27 [Xylella fastidiosa]ADF29507.1 P27 [Xylella fastidiosa]